jgi:hypothetical protein
MHNLYIKELDNNVEKVYIINKEWNTVKHIGINACGKNIRPIDNQNRLS